MELTSLDIRNQSFKKKVLGGNDPEEVQAFLVQVANELERQVKARNEANEQLKITEERVNYYKLIEKTLQDSVVTMQKTVDDAKANAEKEAELIIAEAKARAVRESDEIRRQADELRKEIAVLRAQKTNYFIRIRSLLTSQEELLQAMERDAQAMERDAQTMEREAMPIANPANPRTSAQNLNPRNRNYDAGMAGQIYEKLAHQTEQQPVQQASRVQDPRVQTTQTTQVSPNTQQGMRPPR